MTVHEEKARALFCSGYNCAQAVFAAFAAEFGVDEKTAAKIASSFGGGMGGTRSVCGAASGMLMAAGLIFGYDDPQAKEEKRAHYADIARLLERFREENGSVICAELLGLGKVTAPIAPSDRTAEYYKKRPCADMVACAARLLDEMIEEKR